MGARLTNRERGEFIHISVSYIDTTREVHNWNFHFCPTAKSLGLRISAFLEVSRVNGLLKLRPVIKCLCNDQWRKVMEL